MGNAETTIRLAEFGLEKSSQWMREGGKNPAFVKGCFLFKRSNTGIIQIGGSVSANLSHARLMGVIEYDNAADVEHLVDHEEIDERVIEGMRAVDEGKLDASSFLIKPGRATNESSS